MEVIFIMWGVSALLIILAMSFEYYVEKLDNSRPLKKWWNKRVHGDYSERIH